MSERLDEMAYRLRVDSLRRVYRLHLIGPATFQQRLVEAIHDRAGVPMEYRLGPYIEPRGSLRTTP